MTKTNSGYGMMDGMTARNAICGVMAALAVSTSLVIAGMRLGTSGPSAANVTMILLNVLMLVLMLFTSWNTGRASKRRDDYVEPSAPNGDNGRGKPEQPVVA